MIVEPAVTEVTNPVASTVATLLLDEDQTPPVVASANCVVAPIHTSVEPVIAATTGSGFTITCVDAEVAAQPEAFVTFT